MSGNPGDLLPVFGSTSKGQAIDSAVHQVMFHRTSNDVQFSVR